MRSKITTCCFFSRHRIHWRGNVPRFSRGFSRIRTIPRCSRMLSRRSMSTTLPNSGPPGRIVGHRHPTIIACSTSKLSSVRKKPAKVVISGYTEDRQGSCNTIVTAGLRLKRNSRTMSFRSKSFSLIKQITREWKERISFRYKVIRISSFFHGRRPQKSPSSLWSKFLDMIVYCTVTRSRYKRNARREVLFRRIAGMTRATVFITPVSMFITPLISLIPTWPLTLRRRRGPTLAKVGEQKRQEPPQRHHVGHRKGKGGLTVHSEDDCGKDRKCTPLIDRKTCQVNTQSSSTKYICN